MVRVLQWGFRCVHCNRPPEFHPDYLCGGFEPPPPPRKVEGSGLPSQGESVGCEPATGVTNGPGPSLAHYRGFATGGNTSCTVANCPTCMRAPDPVCDCCANPIGPHEELFCSHCASGTCLNAKAAAFGDLNNG